MAIAAVMTLSPIELTASGGQLWSFGQNYNGQLFDDTSVNHITPQQVVSAISAVAAGGSATEGGHALYLKTDGSLWAVGYNAYGQLGDTTTINRLTAVPIATGVQAVSAGINHSLFLKTDGTLWAMGLNLYGQLGDGSTTNRATPVQITSGVSTIAAGGNHSLFLKTDGTLWATGYNAFGQLGDGNKPNNRSSPVQVATGVSRIAAGGSHSLFLKTDNTLWVTGWNSSGQLGVGPDFSYLGTAAQLDTGVTAIAAGNQHSLYLKTDGSVWAMGQNLFGQLGDGTMPTSQKIPVLVTSQVSALSTGVSHSLLLKTDGSLWAMGLNTSGQLGDGTTSNRSTPIQVADEVLSAAGGAESSYFIKAPGLITQLDSWTALSSGPTNNFTTLLYADRRFVAGTTGLAPPGTGGLSLISVDGLSWTTSAAGALSNIDVAGFAYGSSLYVAVGALEVGSGGASASSSDGLVWSASSAAPQPLTGIAYGNSQFVAVGAGGHIQTSPDGSTWTTRTSGTSNGLTGVTYGGTQFVAVGNAGTLLTSPNGVSWIARASGASGTNNNLTSVIYGDSQFVAVGNGIITSPDGATWTQRISAYTDGTVYYAITYRLGQYVAVGTSTGTQGALLSSSDGISWTAHNPGVASTLRGVGYGSNRFLLVGDNGTVLSSPQAGSTPVILTNPVNQTVYAGSPASFSVTATGLPPLTYQWQKNSSAIAGATSATYSIAAADTADTGSLTAVVTNPAGKVTTTAATLTVIKATQTISFPSIPTHYYADSPFTLSATASPSSLPVTFSVVSGPVTLAGSTVTITGVGAVTLRASQAGNTSYYAAVNVDRTFTVAKATPVITWATPAAIIYGTALSSIQLNATADFAGAFTYSPAAAVVLNSGTPTLTTTFTPTDAINYTIVTDQRTLTVNKATASVALSALSATYDGAAHPATATTSAGALTVDLTYNGSPTVPVTAGTYAVVGTINSINYSGTTSGTLTIAKANQTITFNSLVDRFWGDPPITLAATSAPTGYPVSFSIVSGPATIASNVATLTGIGTVTIRASQAGDLNYNAAPNVDRSFAVLNPLPVITWAQPTGITYGTVLGSTQLNATANVPGTFVYNPGSGTILNAGSRTITATFTPTNTSSYSTATAQQTLTVSKATPVLTWGPPAAILYGTPLDSTQLNATTNSIAGTFTYYPASGAVLGIGTQTLTTTFTPSEPANFNETSAQQALTVNRATATVTLGSLNTTYDGTPRSATATTSAGTLPINFTYDGAATAPTNVGSYLVVATINDPNYTGATSGTLVIAKASQTLTFAALPTRLKGDPPFGLTASASSNLSVSFAVVSGPATVAGNIVTLTDKGSVTIRASQSGNTSYNAAPSVDRVFTVSSPTPAITWPTPSAIPYGTALGATQLNATTSIPGTFTYNPKSGTVLPAGSQALTVIFSPTDNVNYQAATAQQTIVVNSGSVVITLSGFTATYDGNAKPVVATTVPSGIAVSLTYNNSSTAPSNAGTYAISAASNDPGYIGSATGTLVIAKVTPVITWVRPAAQLFGTALSGTQLNATANLANGTFAYSPASGTLLTVGENILTANFSPTDAANYNSASAQVSLTIVAEPTAPVFTTQPVSRKAATGNSVIFTAIASGIPAPVYQWRKNGVDLAGATNASLALGNVQAADAGSYTVVATNLSGAVTSAVATLTVSSGPGDFNRDNSPDILWQNTTTGARRLWLMVGTVPSTTVALPTVGTDWQFAGTADFNADNSPDILWQNTTTGERGVGLMNGTNSVGFLSIGRVDPAWRIAGAGDFNADGQPDIVWENTFTGDHGIWLMNGMGLASYVELGFFGVQWSIAGLDDFNRDGQTDILWQNSATGEHKVWLMNGPVKSSEVLLGYVALEWCIAAVADYNLDGLPDILWQNSVTGEHGIWLMNGTTRTVYIPLPNDTLDWVVGRIPRRPAAADFGRSGKPSIIWQNSVTGERKIWLMNGTIFDTEISYGNVALDWQIAGAADYNGDGLSDILWQNTTTGERGLWLMNGTQRTGWFSWGVIPAGWQIVGAADFNADNHADILWQDLNTGERSLWLMNETALSGSVSFGNIPVAWQIAGAADFNRDDSPDIIWENSSTGERKIWFMNGTTMTTEVSLGIISTDWSITAAADYNLDGSVDIVWQNTITGECGIWLMNGTTRIGYIALTTQPLSWQIVN